MRISRRGSLADHGTYEIDLNSPVINWKMSDRCLTVKQAHIRDFNTKSHHEYTIKINMSEITKIIASLAQAAQKDPNMFEKDLKISLKDLCQLQAIAAGLNNAAYRPRNA
jgi:hypothetical protein